MTTIDDDAEGIRGSELADDGAADSASRPDPDELGAHGLRGAGLADGAGLGGHPPPDPDEAAEDGIRGDGLAKDD